MPVGEGLWANAGPAVSTNVTTATPTLRTNEPAKAPKCYHSPSRAPGVPELFPNARAWSGATRGAHDRTAGGNEYTESLEKREIPRKNRCFEGLTIATTVLNSS